MSWNNPIPWNSRTEPPVRTEGMSAGAANAASVGTSKFSPAAVASIASAGGSTLSSIINYASQRATNRSNERMNRENNEYNLRLWQMNNEYNTPANQRRRMEEAGFNPNLMYGSMSPGNSSSPAQSESHYNEAPQIGDLGAAFGNAYQIYKQSQLIDAETNLKQAQAEDLSVQARLKERSLTNDEQRIEIDKQNLQHSMDELEALKPVYQAQIEKLKADKKVSDEQADEIFWRNEIASKTYGYQMERLRAELDKIKSEYNLNNKQANYYQHMAELYAIEVLKGNVDYTYYGLQKWYETQMLGNAWVRDDASLIPDLNSFYREDKIESRRTTEYLNSWNIFMRYIGATTGAIGNIFSGNANYQLNSGSSFGSKAQPKFKLRF